MTDYDANSEGELPYLDSFKVGDFGAILSSAALARLESQMPGAVYIHLDTVMDYLGAEFIADPNRAAETIRAYCGRLPPGEGVDVGAGLVEALRTRPAEVINQLVELVLNSGLVDDEFRERREPGDDLPWGEEIALADPDSGLTLNYFGEGVASSGMEGTCWEDRFYDTEHTRRVHERVCGDNSGDCVPDDLPF
ncbi:hypothetical protein HN592_01365 [Candidatus Woesearchaeota archaeon]|jgi:hypothetical protein|nr:hypothetical protein [Candidatus Woesearchaeota archaeon]MBT4368660.1 hypothetical protein [Candidatus Woesearchaeota archaeon]MBT4712215.1 hypothetical protein [Candidatus Woesearchaeota archaeon]MBT6638953.1 hypothetical protein [Candidatus Woesearchaeota archaeon]MBT7134145.1 hypothetical protein [Candidatus Woesearchaeota archaeon]